MSAAQAALIPELEEALRQIPVQQCAETAQRVTDFFIAGAAQFNEQHVLLFDRILGRLLELLKTEALAQLARRLAAIRNAPSDVVRRLARDNDIAVAGPVLTRSHRLADADLVEIASTRSQAHKFAISSRSALSEAVTDVLVDCGDRDVARNLAMNQGARFSLSGIAMLSARAVNDAVLAQKLGRRADVPPAALRTLLVDASAEVRRRLLAVIPPAARAEIDPVVDDVPDRNADAAAEHVEAWRTVRALRRAGHLDEAHVLELAESGRMMETTAALAVICHVPVDVVRRLTSGEQPDAAFILCQAAGFSGTTARAIVAAAAGDARDIETALAHLDGLSASTAERIVGFWRACHAGE